MVDIPYEALTVDPILNIPITKGRRLQGSITAVRRKYLKCIEELLDEHKRIATDYTVYIHTNPPPN